MFSTISYKNKIALVAVCLSAVMLGLEITSIPSILPTLKSLLPADFQQLQWIMNAYTIAMCSVLVATGALADRFGRKRIFIAGITVFAIASLICGLAGSATVLIAARFLQGLSAAAMLSCQVAVLSHQFQNGNERGVAFATWGIVFGLGLGFGPIVGGIILELASWQWVFLIHVVIAALTLLLAKKGVTESSNPNAGRMDFGGMITLSLSVFGLVYLITQGHESGLSSDVGMFILVGSIVSLLLFIVIENKVKHPMFDFSAFKVRNFSGALFGASGMNFSFWPFVIYFPIYLQSVLGYSAIMSGLTVLALTLPTIIVPPYAERMLLKKGAGFVIPLGLFTISAGFVAIWFAVTMPSTSWLTLLPGCLIAGVGLGLTNTPVTNTATGSLPPERAGMASGMEFSARMISLAVNIAIMGLVLVQGVAVGLADTLPLSGAQIEVLAGAIAAGNVTAAQSFGVSSDLATNILTTGFSWLVLYGAISALILGLAAAVTCERKHRTEIDKSISVTAK
ncbi:MFS transporter [Vibrio rumoiensis]|uniref:MFS transporter n=1 Tax=Vibrio rumoiensis 1S-45 TaxID=1188252 RepID=A0A1E5E530_9VIBR|nr:MFS transporter [Vibrio rumoiensis]OEF28170.1 MFS transporter [Vibrio rumoiensis 1S-45]